MPCSRRLLPCCVGFVTLFAPLLAGAQSTGKTPKAALEFFEKKVRPVFVAHCFNCHSANTNSRGGLRVDDRNGLIAGGDRGPAVVPGDPEKSLLMQAIRHTHRELKMPPKEQLTEEQIADVARWIKDGAAWPEVQATVKLGRAPPEYAKLRAEHWAWQALRAPRVPDVKNGAWARDDLDRFVLAALEAKGLAPVKDASPEELIRRMTFDLNGLPPRYEEVQAFLSDVASTSLRAATERLVDRLLASPQFGERWGRHWLDVARYGESTGSARNVVYPHAWRYRDYVIDSFNSDKPYDRFLREQIAGDLLKADSQAQRDEQLVATGFLALGVCDVNQRFKVRFVMDNIDEQIDTVSRAVLGLTVSCARCHDHKFDPIPTADYYALAGIFHSSQRCAGVRNKMGGGGLDYYDTAMLLPLRSPTGKLPAMGEKIEPTKLALAKAKAELQSLQGSGDNTTDAEREKSIGAARAQVKKMQEELLTLNDPAAHGPVALGVRDAESVGDTQIRIRGEAEKLGPTVPRGFLSVFKVPHAPTIDPSHSGRLELAEWLSSKHNPLTSRVMANRIWLHLFGEGLVSSVDNFGVTGDLPSHPDLLDHLSTRFMADDWSVKKLVRSIVLSRAYQLDSEAPAKHLDVDPGNRLIWRHAPRRLDAEETRDAMLSVAGRLELSRPEGSPAQQFKVVELRNDGAEAKRLEAHALSSPHRSIYLPLLRGLTPRSLEVFDFAEQGMVTGSRETTTVATQALYLLNDSFVRQQARALTDRLLELSVESEGDRVSEAYRLTLGRTPTAREISHSTRYLAEYEAAVRNEKPQPKTNPKAEAWTSFCQAILASAEFRYIQ